MAASYISSPESMRLEKRSVARNSVLAAIAMTALKIVLGFITGSLGLIAEAAHSTLDLIAAIITFFSVGVSDKPADADHQYGHGKVENFSAFIETGLLLVTCVWIVTEAIRRLFFHHHLVIEPSLMAFAVLFLSMIVDFWRSRALGRTALRYDSHPASIHGPSSCPPAALWRPTQAAGIRTSAALPSEPARVRAHDEEIAGALRVLPCLRVHEPVAVW